MTLINRPFIKEPVIFKVICDHPEDSSWVYHFAFPECENVWDDTIYKEWIEDIKKTIQKTINNYGYWHTVTIYQQFIIDGVVYEKEVE